ncbi:DNA repair protein RadA [Cryobacterium sp. PH31-O1]|uniref:DNA repair protein RadA n=1 Tax=Cryobacterium sp. PH31-O1 TaxID=3046306 RepID=UPI0024B99C9A|nr:DNA repair protein RadA [Cryobacterium sp. PH31-O1]MDJ0337873.1 DNA repair protein RadA [Cryobacterium sp. PH31-O1]
MAKSVSSFRCSECGWTTLKWAGRCGECQQWGTVVDAGQSAGITRKLKAITLVGDGIARPITHVETDAAAHWPTGINEFDRVLGGGIVPGSVILLSGEPGVGKSTLLLEVASKAAAAKSRVLYVSAEESVSQVRLRAERTNALEPELYIAAETDLGVILGQIDAVKPDLIIIDSVQTVSSALSDGSPGMPSQVREVASTLIRVAKDRGLPVLLVGHVTKDGSIAGPRVLEHLVDVVCQFEGDRQTSLRFIRALKNRFGPTDEVGCFEMTGDGIAEVPDPSGLFLSRATEPVDGTCVTVALEGRRAMPVEVQALVTDTQAPNPRRVTSGVDSARVAMLLAVLQERAGMNLSTKDVYVSTVGGIRLSEPAADLAIALAIASAFTGLAVAHNVVAFGEISLAGEVRGALMSKQRVNEAVRLGFTTQIDAACGSIHAAVALALGTTRKPRDAELDRAWK